MTNQRGPTFPGDLAICLLTAGLLLIAPASVANAQEGDADRAVVVGTVPGPAVAAAHVYMQFGDIKGESTDRAHSDWIDVLSVDWGAKGTPVRASMAVPQGGAERKRPGRVKYSNITLKKSYDASSANLAQACANGTHIPRVSLEWTTTDADGTKYMRAELQDVIISSYSIDASGDQPIESISLNYAEIKTSYIPQNQRGNVETEWKVEEGQR